MQRYAEETQQKVLDMIETLSDGTSSDRASSVRIFRCPYVVNDVSIGQQALFSVANQVGSLLAFMLSLT
jgi:hypothetical protein